MQKIPVHVFPTRADAATQLALETASLIKDNEAKGKHTVLGLATGDTPVPYYKELIKWHQERGLSFATVTCFNLDEYTGLCRDHPQSYWQFMHNQLFQHIDILPENIHMPSGTVAEADIPAHCHAYEQAILDAGGLDMQILGIGRTGHIGFNEPGSPIDSRTRAVSLDPVTREDAARTFGGLAQVPTSAITMGCGTILSAKRIVLMAWGNSKADIINQALNGSVNSSVSASYLQRHPNTDFYIDAAAASALS
ncbi:glucosamine-6-phosphate deaminase [Rubritalea marina]|uniref:glucosamine-6-phosphate deaminase n=1 Tax=Rubritalea marina TaxID=361055 RepID=UPI0003679E40|nr:glucosamine-6-phosphate deaminase [Rubritalea marina]